MNNEVIKVKYHEEIYGTLPRLQIISVGDWIDLFTAEDIALRKGDFRYISLGVSLELPEGYEAIVAPRSSTFKKYGVLMANSIGIIDNSYSGEDDIWMFPAFATKDSIIKKATRICQFRVLKNQPDIIITEVEKMSNFNRGGLGSTGE